MNTPYKGGTIAVGTHGCIRQTEDREYFNYISLNNLTPPLMQMVDEKKIALTPAYQLASLSEQEQNCWWKP